jgi:hypothetical protein
MKKNTILIIIGILLIALGAWVYIVSNKSPATNADGTPKGVLGSLFPFGSGSGTAPDGETPGTGVPDGTTDETPAPASDSRFAQITKNPTAGFIVVVPPPPAPVKKGTVVPVATTATIVYSTVRYAEAGTGYIYDANAKGANTTKASGTVIARTAQAYFGDNGATVILRYIKTDNRTIATYLGRIVPGVGALFAGDLKGDFLADNIADLVMSPDGKSFLYLSPVTDGSVGTTMKTDGTGKKQTFASPFSEWLLDWSAAGTTVTTKASGVARGYAYIASANGAFSKIVGDVSGLTTKMSPDGKNVLYSVSSGTGLVLRIKHLKDGSDVSTGLSTLAEKCAWTADSLTIYCGASSALDAGVYPDAWYQGTAHFNDSIWKIAAASGMTTLLSDGEGYYLDMTHLALDSKNGFLFFINKTDGSLWSFNIDF